jgi:hypothetical protein
MEEEKVKLLLVTNPLLVLEEKKLWVKKLEKKINCLVNTLLRDGNKIN